MAKLAPISFLLAAFLALSANSARAASRVALLPHVEVQTDAVTLAQLLPQSAPLAIRHASADISFGAAPSYGSSRVIGSSEIVSAMQAAGMPPHQFVIPVRVSVRRASRALAPEEVFYAIEASYQKQFPDAKVAFSADDLEFNSSVSVPPGAAGLKVVALRYDEMLDREIFRLVSDSSPSLVPFEVGLRVPRLPTAPAKNDSPVTAPAPVPVLVDPRSPARLTLVSQDAEIQMQVRPLQRGHLGDSIRVRVPRNGRTFFARVTGPGTVQASF
jgi:Chaperone for flagella basal body P-ring formation